MYLSSLQLNSQHRSARRDLANVYELHRTLTRLLGQPNPGLFRLEQRELLWQSPDQPDWSQLEPGYAQVRCRPLELEQHLQGDQPRRFRLRAHPSIARLVGHRQSDGKRITRRFDLTGIEEQLQWLKSQGQRCGFELVGAMVSQVAPLRVTKGDSQPFDLLSCTFDGHLKVVDPALLGPALRSGIGHGKAWGLGLLSL